ncbi:hypothetical protein [Streptomyces tibetensis]|uniref:hypothetical protein n=1 Tax=Streptomyces tibetensis TaxID=2382123 RepID=UPI003405F892
MEPQKISTTTRHSAAPTALCGTPASRSDGRRRRFLINHRTEPVPLPEPAHGLLTDAPVSELPPGGCVVLRIA